MSMWESFKHVIGVEKPKEPTAEEKARMEDEAFLAETKKKGMTGAPVLGFEGKNETEELRGTGTTGPSYTSGGKQ